MPRLDDDGRTVTLDLHGVRVGDAEALVHAAVVETARHGRSVLRVVHGVSTYERGAERTLKGAVLDLLDDGAFGPHVVSDLRADGHVVLGLAPAPSPAPGRLRLQDLQ